ncbi:MULTISPECIES: NAD(P)-dependent oxidoreductase [Staphylococcus]|uniref:NAD(P)-dependent oxidoreductase n=1 Tax=Staphylococcus TaxID=1279 RepID=UPI0008A1E9EA|nr:MULTISPECIES: NAD(P)H-binding protein [Staphylococcus]MDT4012245.1 NAD(P)H-binding protein [Staphylococcus simulans]OFJ76688.1 NADH-flavin reductase [Staphylococcus sp. HMSC056G08]
MKIAIISATGKQGTLLTEKALERNHEVTAFVRNHNKLQFDVPYVEKDILDITREDLEGFDAVFVAFGAPKGKEELYIQMTNHLINILDGIDVKLMFVGGTGRLYIDDSKTTRVADNPNIPETVKESAIKMAEAYDILAAQDKLKDWTFVSPASMFDFNGPETNDYKLGTDTIIYNSRNKSYVSYSDFSNAFIDEAENDQYPNQGITVVSG